MHIMLHSYLEQKWIYSAWGILWNSYSNLEKWCFQKYLLLKHMEGRACFSLRDEEKILPSWESEKLTFSNHYKKQEVTFLADKVTEVQNISALQWNTSSKSIICFWCLAYTYFLFQLACFSGQKLRMSPPFKLQNKVVYFVWVLFLFYQRERKISWAKHDTHTHSFVRRH